MAGQAVAGIIHRGRKDVPNASLDRRESYIESNQAGGDNSSNATLPITECCCVTIGKECEVF